MSYLCKFVFSTLRTSIAPPLELTAFACTSIEFLWLLIQHRPVISVADQDKLIHNALYVYTFTAYVSFQSATIASNQGIWLRTIEEHRILNVDDRRAFGQALGDVELQNLVGRTLLIATQGHEPREIQLWEAFLGTILQVAKSAAYASIFTPARIPGAKADWAKVWEQIEVFWGLSLSDRHRAEAARQRVADMHRAWDRIHLVLDHETGVPHKAFLPDPPLVKLQANSDSTPSSQS
ncbi:hypothetical protein FRC07_011956, partial [Ceratobasidium sp. 392]